MNYPDHLRECDAPDDEDCQQCIDARNAWVRADKRAERAAAARRWHRYRWFAIQRGEWYDADERARQARITEVTA